MTAIVQAGKAGTGRGFCRGCLRSMYHHGSAGYVLCTACLESLRRSPLGDLAAMRNGRSERLPQERPVADGSWRFRVDGPRCPEAPAELFEPRTLPTRTIPEEIHDTARAFCRLCPVLRECDAEANAHEYTGLVGGRWRYYTVDGRQHRYVARDLLGRNVDTDADTGPRVA